MGAQLTSNSVDWGNFDTETVTITRDVPSQTLPVTYSTLTLYSGAADFQARGGNVVYNPSGAVDEIVGQLAIDPDSSGNLPTGILPGDVATIGAVAYTVVEAIAWNATPKHLEVTLKRGGGPYSKT